METLKFIARAALGVVLAIVLLPVFVWLGLAAIGASAAAIVLGTALTAWQLRKSQANTINL